MNIEVNNYISNARIWKEEMLALRSILLETELV